MNNSIYYIRSTSIINDSRASKEITSLINNNYNVVVIGWDRDKKIKDYSIRFWQCPKCDSKHDRDYNVANNILDKGIELLLV